ncbi:alpha-ketoglutarate-dependent dioxygenase alkB homolog 6-like [Branchiostoma lanceolatum]|uniref:alpha-ketoglutarate-dependent dioxygenase alkB homolog 6-like n=1 Tax=Branchiostoma lanceolatum TaxID=7740 RepID=UPI0034559014
METKIHSEDLPRFRVQNVAPMAYYIPDFITEEEESYLLAKVYAAPKPKWTRLSNRRLQNWGGLPHPKGMVVEKLPEWLQMCADRIHSLGVFQDKRPNHVLVNEYQQGQGIMPHEDGPLFYPTITTVNLGSHTLLDFYKPLPGGEGDAGSTEQANVAAAASCDERYTMSFFLERRSLLILQEDLYHHFLHGIAEQSTDAITDRVRNLTSCGAAVGDTLTRDTRVSLTIRHVPKTLKVQLRLGRR